MTDEFTRRHFLFAALLCGVSIVASCNKSFAEDDDDDSDDDNSDDDNSDDDNSDDSNDDDSNDDDSNDDDSDDDDNDDDDDSDDDDNSGTGSGNAGSGSSGTSSNKISKSRAQREVDRAKQAVVSGKAVPLRKLMAHMKAFYGGKVLDVKLSRSLFRYTYNVKHLGKDGRLQNLRLDALSLKKL